MESGWRIPQTRTLAPKEQGPPGPTCLHEYPMVEDAETCQSSLRCKRTDVCGIERLLTASLYSALRSSRTFGEPIKSNYRLREGISCPLPKRGNWESLSDRQDRNYVKSASQGLVGYCREKSCALQTLFRLLVNLIGSYFPVCFFESQGEADLK